MEFRINAEDPLADFSPTTGRIEFLQIPHGPGVRVDSCLSEGMVVSPYYDSLVAKLITFGSDFEQARRRALVSLDEFSISGINTTIPFHRELVRNERFIRGEMDTNFIHTSGILKQIAKSGESSLQDEHFIIAALLLSRNQFSDGSKKASGQLSTYGTKEKKGGRFSDAL